MPHKLRGSYYLDRSEVVDYMLAAFDLKWCMTRWASSMVNLTFETSTGKRGTFKAPGYVLSASRTIHLSKIDVDLQMKLLGLQ